MTWKSIKMLNALYRSSELPWGSKSKYDNFGWPTQDWVEYKKKHYKSVTHRFPVFQLQAKTNSHVHYIELHPQNKSYKSYVSRESDKNLVNMLLHSDVKQIRFETIIEEKKIEYDSLVESPPMESNIDDLNRFIVWKDVDGNMPWVVEYPDDSITVSQVNQKITVNFEPKNIENIA